MPEGVACLKECFQTVGFAGVAEFELQNWRPKYQDWFAVLPMYSPHPMRIPLSRNGTSLEKTKIVMNKSDCPRKN